MTSVELPTGTLVKAEAIWDRDHGTDNEGWYLRCTYADGTEEDDNQ